MTSVTSQLHLWFIKKRTNCIFIYYKRSIKDKYVFDLAFDYL